MGKVPTATAATATATVEMKRKKKKGRPAKNPVPLSTPPKPAVPNPTNRRSTRRNPNHLSSPPQPEFDDDDDERKEKKVKLVVRLPQSDEKSNAADKYKHQYSRRHSRDFDSASGSVSGSESDPESEDREERTKKRKIDGVDRGSDDGVLDQDNEAAKATDTPLQGSPLESGPTTPLPDKKILVFILDRLQKKDTYGVFSEPVDPKELPDYFEIIEQPMDFGTVRKKLDNGTYKNLEELEADVFLICSNAMQYNASDTVYYRQARTIQELAKRDFKNLRHEGDDGEPQPKVVRRGRPPSSKNQKKPVETSPVDRVVSNELSSGATLANGEDKANGSNSYNLRKVPPLSRFRSTDPFVSSYGSRNGENYSEWMADWNDEFPASILRADMKYGKKQFTVDENKRDSYKQSLQSLGNNSPNFYNSIGSMKRLVPVGLQESFAYARSLARYAANLGPVAWKLASKKIEAVLPAGVQYGPGWVCDNGPQPSQPSSFPAEKQKSSNTTAGDCNSSPHGPPDGVVEAVRKLNSPNELARQGDAASWRTRMQFPAQQNPMHHQSYGNGLYGYDLSAATGAARVGDRGSVPSQMAEMGPANGPPSNVKASLQQRGNTVSVPPDLNIRVPGGSPSSSSLQIGSPQQPDLALQL